MIKSEREYKRTKAAIESFKESIEVQAADGRRDPGGQAALSSARAQLDDLNADVTEWERLRSGGIEEVRVASWDDLPSALIRARIAKGLTQEQLAGQLGLKKQQVQRWEDENYEHAEFWRVVDIAETLGLSLNGTAKLDEPSLPDIDAVKGALKRAGVHSEFIDRCLFPLVDASGDLRDYAELTGSRLRAVWNTSMDTILAANANDPLWLAPVANCRFKRAVNAAPAAVAAYASYSKYLLSALCQLVPNSAPLPSDPAALRLALFGSESPRLERALVSAWCMGIPVLPIRSGGGFHGVCFRLNGRSAIALKQSLGSPARWLFDLSHELAHLAQDPDDNFVEVDVDDYNDQEEERAHYFAAQVLLGADSESLFSKVWQRANGRPERLKKAAQHVASDENVDLGLLAQHVAFRVSKDHGINWWGAAKNLEEITELPFETAARVMLNQINLKELPQPAQGMVAQALKVEARS